MITREEIKKIIRKIDLEKNISSENYLSEDVEHIVYRVDFLECGSHNMINKHIDIEFAFGEYFELHEGENLYQYIFKLCNLTDIKAEKETEILLYQK